MAMEDIGIRIGGDRFNSFLQETLVDFGDRAWTREELLALRTPHPRSLGILQRVCQRHHIGSLRRLFDIGLQSLANCQGVGDGTLIVAGVLLEDAGYNVDAWIRSTKMVTLKGAAHEATRKGKKRRHE